MDSDPVPGASGELGRLWRFPIFYRLAGAFLLVVLLPVIGLSFYSYVLESRSAIEREVAALRSASYRMAADIDRYLATNRNLIHLVSLNSELRAFARDGRRTAGQVADFNRWLQLQGESSPELSVLFVLGTDGTCLSSTDPSFIGSSYAMRYYFREAMRGNVYQSDWSIGLTSGQPGVFLSAPVVDGGSTVGVVVLKIRIDRIVETVAKWQAPEGDAFLLNSAGVVLTHTRPEYDYHSLTPLSKADVTRIEEDQQFAGRPIPSEGLLEIRKAFDRTRARHQTEIERYRFQGREKVAALTRLRGKDWVVGVGIAEEVVHSGATWILYNTLAFSLATLAGATLLGLLMSRLISQPILSLTGAVNRFGTGEREVRARVDSSDEIGQLAGDFNRMADAISRHTRDLEAIVRDRTRELEVLNEELRALTIHDGLTGCFNRRYMDGPLVSDIAQARRFRLWLAVVMCDIDHFKAVNDGYGHAAGDAVLKGIGKMLKAATREDVDRVIRYGGEEFLLVLPRTDLEGAVELAGRLRASLQGRTFQGDGHEIGVTASFGVVAANYASDGVQGVSLDALTSIADELLYEAKRAGRNRVVARAV